MAVMKTACKRWHGWQNRHNCHLLRCHLLSIINHHNDLWQMFYAVFVIKPPCKMRVICLCVMLNKFCARPKRCAVFGIIMMRQSIGVQRLARNVISHLASYHMNIQKRFYHKRDQRLMSLIIRHGKAQMSVIQMVCLKLSKAICAKSYSLCANYPMPRFF